MDDLQGGTFTFTIEATDNVTGEDTREDFSITINSPPPPDPPPAVMS